MAAPPNNRDPNDPNVPAQQLGLRSTDNKEAAGIANLQRN